MIDAEALRQIFSLQSAAWTFTTICFLFVWRMWNGAPAMFAQWIAYRKAKADEKASDWSRLREENKRIDERCTRLELAEEKCREQLAEVQQRLAAFEGYQAGYGRASQEAAGIVAIERLNEKPKDKP